MTLNFEINMMQRKDYKDWGKFMKNTTKRKGTINFSKCFYFRFFQNYKSGYGCNDSYIKYISNDDIKVSKVKGRGINAGLNFDLSNIEIHQKYTVPIPLSPEKHADLVILVSEWVPPAIEGSLPLRSCDILRIFRYMF